jgi:hypothetical protein
VGLLRDLADLVVVAPLLAGPFGVALPGSAYLVLVTSVRRRQSLGAVLTVVATVAGGLVWWVWGLGFEAAEGPGQAPGWVDPTMTAASLTCVAATAAAWTLVLVGLRGRARRDLDLAGTMEA